MTSTSAALGEQMLCEVWDREQIRTLIARVSRGVDRVQEELIRACYADDSYDDHGSFKGTGAQFAARPGRSHPNNVATNHLLGQTLIEINGDTAKCETYFHAVTVSRDADGLHQADLAGRYIDQIVRTPEGWQIEERLVRMDWATSKPVDVWAGLDTFTRGERWPDDSVFADGSSPRS